VYLGRCHATAKEGYMSSTTFSHIILHLLNNRFALSVFQHKEFDDAAIFNVS
jgi:hypothetical protein